MPPDFKDVPKLTKQLMAFVNASFGNSDPIILAGLFHGQCVIIDELKRLQKALPKLQPVRLQEHLQLLLGHIEECGSITQAEYGKLTNRSLPSRKIDFRKLVGLGLIAQRGGGRSTYYVPASRYRENNSYAN